MSKGLGENCTRTIEASQKVYTKSKRVILFSAPFCLDLVCQASPLGRAASCLSAIPAEGPHWRRRCAHRDADDLFSPVDPFTCMNVSGADSGLLPLNLKIAQQ